MASNAIICHPPAIPYSQIKHTYFTYQGIVYNLVSSASEIFKAAILATSPVWPDGFAEEAINLLESNELDITARWFLLCLLGKARASKLLYASRDEAARASAAFA